MLNFNLSLHFEADDFTWFTRFYYSLGDQINTTNINNFEYD